MSKHFTFLVGLIALITMSGKTQAQQASVPAPHPSAPAAAQLYRYYTAESMPADFEADQKLHQAIEKYRGAGDDSAVRNESRTEISTLLAEKYDLLLKKQEEELNQLETKLTKLRNQLKQRREAKQKMVELKLEMVIAQADGLGWPDGDSTHSTIYSGRLMAPLQGTRGLMKQAGEWVPGQAALLPATTAPTPTAPPAGSAGGSNNR